MKGRVLNNVNITYIDNIGWLVEINGEPIQGKQKAEILKQVAFDTNLNCFRQTDNSSLKKGRGTKVTIRE